MSEKVYYFIDWEKVVNACRKIANEVRSYNIEAIVPIMRGGLIPSAIISHELEIDKIVPINTNQTDKLVEVVNSYKNVLLIDDIVDTGSTFSKIYSIYNETLIYSSIVLNTNVKKEIIDINLIHHGISIEKDKFLPYNLWVVFPWETMKSTNL